MEANTKAIATVFNRLSAQLVNIAEAWEATDNINDLDQNITAFTDMAAVEVEKEVGELEYNAYIELMGELGRYAGVWVNLYLNRASWSNRPEWLANSVRNAMNNGANTTESMNETAVTKPRRPIDKQDAAAYDAGFIAKGRNSDTCRWYWLADANGMDARNSKGERIVIEVTECINPGGSLSIPALWHKKGHTPTELQTWWSVDTYIYDANGNCFRAYNPQTKPGTHQLCFDWVKEATTANLRELLEEVARQFYAA